VAQRVPQRVPHQSHIARRKGIYCYRRRLPGIPDGEVCVSLRTRHLREGEHRAALLDGVFDQALGRARETVTDETNLNAILRNYLRDFLAKDLRQRMERPPGSPVYGHWWQPGDPGTAAEADLWAIRNARDSLRHDLDRNDPKEMGEYAEDLVRKYGLPDHLLGPLTVGLIEAAIRGWSTVERRTLGTEPMVFEPEPQPPAPTSPQPPPAPLASSLVDAFGEWGRKSGGWSAGGENQAKVSVTLFAEVCGDKPINSYTRTDGDAFRSTLRRLPRVYRKSAKERDKPLSQIIAEGEAAKAPTLSEKTAKRHFWAVSRFFAFLVETGRLPKDAENLGRGFTFNTKGPARKQRDMWTGDELHRLFVSPVWTGCHASVRSRPGNEIIRDALFWLPLLGLFHGNRLEEFAQLRREDVAVADGVPFLRITDDDGRRLKNAQSRRDVPLHPELIRLGFLEHVAQVTARPNDPVFPELKPGGKDRKVGYYFTKQFSNYRQTIGVRRRGLDYHSFRHGVTTKLYQADVSEAVIDLLTGHDQGGGESRRRYLKGIPRPQLRAALERVTWPELDLSALYVREAGDERWPLMASKSAA
jgi:integrase